MYTCQFCKNTFVSTDVYWYEYKGKWHSNVCKYCIAKIDSNTMEEYIEEVKEFYKSRGIKLDYSFLD